jgi:transposase
VHSELQRDGVTLKLLWEEHADGARAQGLVPKSYGTFCRNYREYAASRNVTNHLEHKPGQVMEVDWSGTTMQLVDRFTGEVAKARLFVATLPYSQNADLQETPTFARNPRQGRLRGSKGRGFSSVVMCARSRSGPAASWLRHPSSASAGARP